MAWGKKRLWRNGRLVSGGDDDLDHWISLGLVGLVTRACLVGVGAPELLDFGFGGRVPS
jgi:hypothetical protein